MKMQTPTDRVPTWMVEEAEIVPARARHAWMCNQLLDRRKLQFQLARYPYGQILRELFALSRADEGASVEPERVIEVLSDGLGYIEPDWHAVEQSAGDLSVIASQYQENLRKRIAALREGLSESTRTQRAIGNLLYESTLFAVFGESVWVLDTSRGVERWCRLDDLKALPLKALGGGVGPDAGDPAASLLAIARTVLWPAFFPDGPDPSRCLTMVLLHTSLWHEAAGVWAFHAQFPCGVHVEAKEPTLSTLITLVAPAVCCLEDVTGWAYQREGLHRQRRQNVNFLYHALGVENFPAWHPDGLECATTDRKRDTAVYDLPADAPLSITTRRILDVARGKDVCSCGKWHLVGLGFTAVRLVRRSSLTSLSLADDDLRPSTIHLYAQRLLTEVGHDGDRQPQDQALVDLCVRGLRAQTSLCETCRDFAENLERYWGLVQEGTARG